MILIVGGLGAGKREFAMETFGIRMEDLSCAVLDERPALYDLQKMEPLPTVESLADKRIVICNEVGSGVVPIDREERAHREAVGRLCVELAKTAQAVYRVQCGIGMRLK